MSTIHYRAIRCCALALLAVLAGCHRETMILSVRSPADMNAGRPVRLLVRAVDQQEYVSEAYSTVADKVVIKDDSVLYSAVVYPHLPLIAAVRKARDKNMAVYILFTTPGARWKTLLEMPLPHGAEINLGSSNIESIRQY